MITFGSIFAGIGGFDLGLERAGMVCKWQVEIDSLCIKVLEKHWPHVRRYGDIKTINWEKVKKVDCLCGGFPCQPHSLAGKQFGRNDDRDLWDECLRCLSDLRPRYAIFENVPGLLTSERGRFFNRVISDLVACGYAAEWQVIPAYAIGSPQTRKRIFIVAYPASQRCDSLQVFTRTSYQAFIETNPQTQWGGALRLGSSQRVFRAPDTGTYRVVDGFSDGLDRLHTLGNAIVPQVAELVGFCLMRYIEKEKSL